MVLKYIGYKCDFYAISTFEMLSATIASDGLPYYKSQQPRLYFYGLSI